MSLMHLRLLARLMVGPRVSEGERREDERDSLGGLFVHIHKIWGSRQVFTVPT